LRPRWGLIRDDQQHLPGPPQTRIRGRHSEGVLPGGRAGNPYRTVTGRIIPGHQPWHAVSAKSSSTPVHAVTLLIDAEENSYLRAVLLGCSEKRAELGPLCASGTRAPIEAYPASVT